VLLKPEAVGCHDGGDVVDGVLAADVFVELDVEAAY
jgi:hypothetical protein